MGNTKIIPIAMKCNQEQFEAVKGKFNEYGLHFENIESDWKEWCYLKNNSEESKKKVFITNIKEDWKSRIGRKVYETWNEEIFLNACGIETQPNYTITKDTIEKYQMKDEFPDVFENKLPIYFTGWAKYDKKDNEKWTCYFKYGNFQYGINSHGDWFTNKKNEFKINPKKDREATEQEVFESLKNEAVKRGFNSDIPIHIKSRNAYSYLAKPSNSDLFFKNNCLYLWEIKIFNKGIWAEIIQTLTKKEAEEKLNCKIV